MRTLEQQLQHVARNLVGTGRAASAQQQQQQQQVMLQQMANNGFPAGGMQSYAMQMQGMGAQLSGMYQQAFAPQQRAMGGMGSAPGFMVAPGPECSRRCFPQTRSRYP